MGAHDIAEEGLDRRIEGDIETGKKLTDKAKQIDPKAVEELAEEVQRDKDDAERFVNKKLGELITTSALPATI